MSSADDLLDKYKRVPFAKGLLPFLPAVEALTTDFAKICAKPDGRQCWVICEKSTGEPAMFSHAAFYAEGSSAETGNFVPGDEEIPRGVDPKVVQRRANSRCFYTYVFDTYVDISLYEGQWALDAYMGKLKGFNPTNLPRRAYQSRQDPKYRSRFWMQTPIFLQKAGQEDKVKVPQHLHEWVLQVEKQLKIFRANPDRPRIWMLDGDTTAPVGEREFGPLQRGDIVAISFTVTYHLTRSNWFPQFHPADVVILRLSDGDPTDYSAPTIDLHSRPPPSFLMGDAGEHIPGVGRSSDVVGPGVPFSEGHGAEQESQVEGSTVNLGVLEMGQVEEVTKVGNASGIGWEGPSDVLGSSGDVGVEDGDGFEMVSAPRGGVTDNVVDGFVDVEAEEAKAPAYGAGAKGGRATRKHG